MAPELNAPIDPSVAIVQRFIGDRQMLHALITSKDDAKEELLDTAAGAIVDLDNSGTESLIRTLISGLGREDDEWGIDQRDGALELLGVVDFYKIPRERLQRIYLDAVSSQNQDSDPYGSISALIEAGKVIAPSLPIGPDARQRVQQAWDNVADQFQPKDRAYINVGARRVADEIILVGDDLIGDTDQTRLGWREMPKLEPAEKSLHDFYLEAIGRQKSFKLTLWDNVPHFRDRSESYGIPLERFWNIADPDQVVSGVTTIKEGQSPLAQRTFETSLQQGTGLSLNELTEEQTRVLADEVVLAADAARAEIMHSQTSFPDVIARFRDMLSEAQGVSRKSQRSIIKPITNFLSRNGVQLESSDVGYIASVIDDPNVMGGVEAGYRKRQEVREQAAATLDRAFGLSTREANFLLGSRTREDLFLGDLTGDCTSYHLYTGMNAWTVPVWLSNPGFNFFKIMDKDKLVAKLGLLLGVADDNPILVVDSFETATGINDQTRAEERILDGLSFLKSWSERIGLRRVLVNGVSNSGGASELLNHASDRSAAGETYLLGGLSGIAELRENVLGQIDQKERIYLQSSGDALFDDMFDDDLPTQEEKEVSQLEQMVSLTLENAEENDRPKIEELARQMDWAGLFKHIVNTNFPRVGKALGSSWESYKGLMNDLVVDAYGVHVKSEKAFASDDHLIAIATEDYLAQQAASGNIDDDYESDLRIEAEAMDDFLEFLKRMESINLTPEAALQRLYGTTTRAPKAQGGVKLTNTLRMLTV